MFLFLLLMLLMHPSSLQWMLRHRLVYLAALGASEACQTMRARGQCQSINSNSQRRDLLCFLNSVYSKRPSAAYFSPRLISSCRYRALKES